MISVTEKKLENPIIILAGDYGVGKSYVYSLVKKYLQSVVSINKYDFITRQLLYILDIHPLEANYNFLSKDTIDRELYKNNNMLNYLKDEIKSNGGVRDNNFSYYVENILNIEKSVYSMFTNSGVEFIVDELNYFINNRKKINIKNRLYKLSSLIYNKIYTEGNEYFTEKYLNMMFPDFEHVYNVFKNRIVYYAYSSQEIQWFKTHYNALVIFVEMSHKFQSQILLRNNQSDKIDEINDPERCLDVDNMKKLSNFIISNELEYDNVLISKIMPLINTPY